MGFWTGMANATKDRADRNERQDSRDQDQAQRDKMFAYNKAQDDLAIKRQTEQDGIAAEDRVLAGEDRLKAIERQNNADRLEIFKLTTSGDITVGTGENGTGVSGGSGSGTQAQKNRLALEVLTDFGADEDILAEFAGHGVDATVSAAESYQAYIESTKDYLNFTPVDVDTFLTTAIISSSPGTPPDLEAVRKANGMTVEEFSSPAYGDAGPSWSDLAAQRLARPTITNSNFPSSSQPEGLTLSDLTSVKNTANDNVLDTLNIQVDNLKKQLVNTEVGPERQSISVEIAQLNEAARDLENNNPTAAISFVGANSILPVLSGLGRPLDYVSSLGSSYQNAIDNVTFATVEDAGKSPNMKVGDWYVTGGQIKQLESVEKQKEVTGGSTRLSMIESALANPNLTGKGRETLIEARRLLLLGETSTQPKGGDAATGSVEEPDVREPDTQPQSDSETDALREMLQNTPAPEGMGESFPNENTGIQDKSLTDSQALYDIRESDLPQDVIDEANIAFEKDYGVGSADAAYEMIASRQ